MGIQSPLYCGSRFESRKGLALSLLTNAFVVSSATSGDFRNIALKFHDTISSTIHTNYFIVVDIVSLMLRNFESWYSVVI
jgi:hypothetical protein